MILKEGKRSGSGCLAVIFIHVSASLSACFFLMSQHESCPAVKVTTLREDYWCSCSLDSNNLSTRIYLKVSGAWIGFVVFELMLRVYDSNVVAAC